MTSTININTATAKELTQLPGIAKNLAYRIVNHRNRHGYFTHWEELTEVKDFPANALDQIKRRANISPPAGILKEEFGPRRVKTKQSHSCDAKLRPAKAQRVAFKCDPCPRSDRLHYDRKTLPKPI